MATTGMSDTAGLQERWLATKRIFIGETPDQRLKLSAPFSVYVALTYIPGGGFSVYVVLRFCVFLTYIPVGGLC